MFIEVPCETFTSLKNSCSVRAKPIDFLTVGRKYKQVVMNELILLFILHKPIGKLSCNYYLFQAIKGVLCYYCYYFSYLV